MKQANKKQKPKQEPKKQSLPYSKIILITGVIVGLLSYYVIKLVTTPPPLPEVDMSQYWGPFPMDQKPDTSIRPFKIEFSDMIVQDLKERLLHHRNPPLSLENTGFTYGFNADFLPQVVDYWRNKYNFQERERFLNKYKHFVTNVQGLDIHFMHVKPKSEGKVVPLLLLHGWPGSVREFYEVIPDLVKPRDGNDFTFEIVVPSLPGFGFSQAASRPGLSTLEISVILHNLMRRLGHQYYYVHGGDFGHLIGATLATLFPDNVKGFHTNMPVVAHPLAHVYIGLGSVWPSMIEVPELHSRLYPLHSHLQHLVQETGYFHLQATKPDTIGVALSDSPGGLAAYILDRFASTNHPKNKMAHDGKLLETFSLTNLLDNIMIYWITNSITTSVRLYAETFNSRMVPVTIDRIPTNVPTCGIKFKHEIAYQPDFVLKLKYTNYLRSTVVDYGGRFPGFEKPDILADDIVDAVGLMLKYHNGKPKESTSSDGPKTVYDFTVNDIKGKPVKLDKYKGKVLIIVNVASQCGLTETNYKQLNQLYEKYHDRGLRILAFPCNQFNGQEPGTAKDILSFIKEKQVKFDLFEKIEVNGDNTDPLWKYLKNKLSGTMGDFVKWNFSKFLVDRNGTPVERFGPNVDPLELEPYLEKYL